MFCVFLIRERKRNYKKKPIKLHLGRKEISSLKMLKYNMNKLHQRTILSILFLIPITLLAQMPDRSTVLERGRRHAKILASPEMAGRGYQEDGALKAARYIADQFKAFGLQPVEGVDASENPYFQPFKFSTNLVDSLSLTMNGEKMKEGEDFIAASITGRGTIEETKVYDIGYGLPKDFKKRFDGGIVMFRSGLPPKKAKKESFVEKYKDFRNDQVKIKLARRQGASGFIVLKPKLTAGFNPIPLNFPVLEVDQDELPGKKIKTARIGVDANLKKITTQNVVGMIPGKTDPDSVIILCAHYDHLGTQGEAIFYGGNDNASGTSLMLALAEHYAQPGNAPDYTMLFIAFGAEEAGLHGSKYYVKKNPLKPLDQTVFVLNMDLMANGDKGITAVAGYDFPDQLEILKNINTEIDAVPLVQPRGNRANSDHYFFVEEGVPAIFIFTMGGPPHYHDINDNYENMQFSRYYEVYQLFVGFLNKLMEN